MDSRRAGRVACAVAIIDCCYALHKFMSLHDDKAPVRLSNPRIDYLILHLGEISSD